MLVKRRKRKKNIKRATSGGLLSFAAHLGTWRGGGGTKKHATALQACFRRWWHGEKYKIYLISILANKNGLSRDSKGSAQGMTQEWLGSLAHWLRAEQVATVAAALDAEPFRFWCPGFVKTEFYK